MFINQLSANPTYFFAVIITVVISITIHELAHGYVAIKLGDRTPIDTGHMTLNPLVHMGLFSIALLFLAGIAFGSMPVDRTRLRGKYAESLVAIAGPASNLVLAVIALVSLGLLYRVDAFASGSQVGSNAQTLLVVFGVMNIALFMFNLIPLPPLDGSMILANLSPAYRNLVSGQMAQGVMMALFFAMFLGGGAIIFGVSETIAFAILKPIAGMSGT